jgi:3-hydroxyisobutyrate dehydrogenase-like beta-hydroxyacid dehydrogenase
MALTVGFLGLGNMGALMAGNVARAGFPLWVYNRTRSKAETLAAQTGAQVASSPAQVAGRCNVLLTMVADGTALKNLYFGPEGMIHQLSARTFCIDMSTVGPKTVQGLSEHLRPSAIRLLDAPVSGSLALARDAQLTIMVGGDSADLAAVRPVLQAMGSRIFHLGPLGAGAAMKLAVNAVVYGLNQAVAEGLVLAESYGIAREVAYDVFENSAIASPFVRYRKDAFLKRDGVPVGFSLELANKDLGLIEEMAGAVRAPMPQSGVNRKTIEHAIQEGRGPQDVTAVAEYLRQAGKDSVGDAQEQ